MRKIRLMIVAVLAMVLVFGIGTAMARDAILFPYFTTGGGNVTFFQIINTAAVATPITGTSQGNLDYVYYYNSEAHKEVCVHYDRTGRVTRNDILLFEASGVYPGMLLPGDTTSTAPPLLTSPAWGSLGVKHSTANFAAGLEGTLFGQAYVVNIPTGTVFAYNAINDPDETDSDFSFSDNADNRHTVSFLPVTYASTTWFFFPVDGYNDYFDDITWNSTLEFSSSDTNGVFDHNEARSSGYKYLPVGCWDTTMDRSGVPVSPGDGPITANFFYNLQQVLNSSQYNAVRGTGGFTDIYWWDWGYAYKFQSSTALGKPMNIMIYEPHLMPIYNFVSDPIQSTSTDMTPQKLRSYSK